MSNLMSRRISLHTSMVVGSDGALARGARHGSLDDKAGEEIQCREYRVIMPCGHGPDRPAWRGVAGELNIS
jgi:hypothetical protein